jgi:predicted site-specific integrase-resolvase
MIPRHLTPREASAATGYSVRQLRDFNRMGVLTVVQKNARVFRFIESELETLANRISDNGRALSTVDNRSGMNREMEQGLADIYGYVPGRTA